ncbi:N-acetylneuraminate synthase family protein [Atopococcus tabaci]|uniref:N-acetylneuraminate synthase family protein n=1 Tax=Atopococcus tabaci TaxID=269774 RepID=UPI000404D836|nr:N-acetylneuraminate synthase family protein [Atopococcus tabaci]
MEKATVIAEIGGNHKGDMEIAKEMIKIAKIFSNADVVKFQKRDVEEWTRRKPEQYNAAHPVPANAYGETYKEHRENLEFDVDQHRELMEYCEEMGITYSTSVWDIQSAKEIAELNPVMIKIPSACNTDYEMLEWLADNYKGEIHVSTGMTTPEETDKFMNIFFDRGRGKDVVLYNCTSGYPVPFEDVALLEINNLKAKYGDKVKAIGFSGHHLGIAVDVAAYTLGATVIERHYTLDRTWKGTDHAASLEPNGLRKLKRDLDAVGKALAYKSQDVLAIEQVQRDKLKYVSEPAAK